MGGDITPAMMHQFEHSCKNYFIHKKILTNDQVSLIIGGFLNIYVNDWISNCDYISALSFDVFIVEFHANFISEDWEEDTLCKLLSMAQGSSFWDFAVAIQSKIPSCAELPLISQMTNCAIKAM